MHLLTGSDIIVSFIVGVVLCLIYFYLLWRTMGIVRKSTHPMMILFFSGALRIFLLIFIALLFAEQNMARLLLIFCVFMLTRFVLLKIAKPAFKQEFEKSEIVYHNEKPKALKSGLKRKGQTKARKKSVQK